MGREEDGNVVIDSWLDLGMAYITESTELLEAAQGSSFFCQAFKARLGSKENFKYDPGWGLAQKEG